jgi:hypothetical protein
VAPTAKKWHIQIASDPPVYTAVVTNNAEDIFSYSSINVDNPG